MTRIIAGEFGGRRLAVPPRGTRPTSDRVREALFTRLEAYDVIAGARVLDLYAGSGALGIEAASRGAASITLVESDRRAAQVCRENVASIGLAVASVRNAKVETFLASLLPEQHWDLVLIDPPYDVTPERVALVLQSLEPHLGPDAVVVVERSTRSAPPALPAGLQTWQDKKYGETTLLFLQRPPAVTVAE